MGDTIKFVSNHTDHSTDNGFQFEFHCDRCSSGFRTRFKPWAIATASNIAEAVGDLFGGALGRATNFGDRVKSAAWEKAHDEAYEHAIEEIKPQFFQCPRCNSWVCRESCMNTRKGLCKSCAPDLGVEMAAAQSSRSVEEVWAHAAMAEEDKNLEKEQWCQNIRATCPQCEKPLETNAKFCPNCGAQLKEKIACPKCGTSLKPGTKFCHECGEKLAGG